MKLAYLILGTFNSGGMERVLCNKSNWLVEHGFDITIITTDQQGRDSFFDFSQKIQMIDLGVDFTNSKGDGAIIKTFKYLKKQRLYRKKLKSFLEETEFDIVVSMFGTEVHWLPTLKDGSKKIAEIHFSKYFRTQQARKGFWAISDWCRSRLDERAITRYDHFVVLTNEDKQYWGDLANIEVIYNACHIEPKAAAPLQNKQAIAVGRLTFQKGYNYMVNAWKIVATKYPDWTLNIYGGGEDRQELILQIEKLSMADKVIINDPTNEIDKKLTESSIYLLSSRYEGLPMVMLESMACGVPCVAFECKCGPRDVIDDRVDGFLIEQNNEEQMADKICLLIEDEKLRRKMGEAAAEKIASKFSMDIIMQQWVKLFETLCNIK